MVIKFVYVQPGHVQNVVGRVVKTRDTESEPLSFNTLYKSRYKIYKRTRFLVTVASTDGKVRQFYFGHMFNLRKVGILGRAWMWVRGVELPKVSYV